MKSKVVLAFCAAGFVLGACIPSVNPWYTTDDVEFDPELVGAWNDEDEVWTFDRRGSEDAYQLIISESGQSSTFIATYFTLREHRFLDIIPNDFELGEGEIDLMEVALVPGHLVLHVAEMEPELRMSFANLDWLEDYLEENPRALSHRIEGDSILLTGSTRELQRFLLRHIDDGELFDEDSYGALTKQSISN